MYIKILRLKVLKQMTKRELKRYENKLKDDFISRVLDDRPTKRVVNEIDKVRLIISQK